MDRMTNTFPESQFQQPPAGNTAGYPADAGAGVQGAPLSPEEKDTVRRGVFGALSYVSQADPGFFATFVEGAAGAKVLAAAPDSVRDLLTGGLILPEVSSPEEFQAAAIPNLRSALALVESRDPAAADALKQLVLQAVQAVAEASKGVSAAEHQAVAAIRQALG